MLRRTLLGAAPTSETLSRRIAATTLAQQRTFATTSRRNAKSITRFTPTSSSELDQLLNTMRHKIILPAFLPADQRAKLHDPKLSQKLKSDPITMEIDGEVIKFYYVNELGGDIPETMPLFKDIIDKLNTSEDFANVKPLLEGLFQAGRKFNTKQRSRLVRVMCRKGRFSELMDCARSVKTTDFRLHDHEVVTGLLTELVMRSVPASASDPRNKVLTQQSLRWTEMVLEMIESEEHQPRSKKLPHELAATQPGLPLNADPVILLAPLHLTAALGDVEKTTKYAREIVRVWPAGTKLAEVQPAWQYEKKQRMEYLKNMANNKPSARLRILAPAAWGMERAIEVVQDQALKNELQTRAKILRGEAETIKNENGMDKIDETRLGGQTYKQLFGYRARDQRG